jgi:hypothetical protein
VAGKLAPSEKAMAPLLSESLTLSTSDNFPERICFEESRRPDVDGMLPKRRSAGSDACSSHHALGLGCSVCTEHV